MNVFKYIKCLLIGHDISSSTSIVETFCSNNWIKKCNCCGRYIMHGHIGSICISEKEALKIKNEFDKMFDSYRTILNHENDKIIMEKITQIIAEQLKTLNLNSCLHDLKELKYYYDDDWGVQGSIAWDEQGKEKTFHYCKKCGQVFVKERERVIKHVQYL